MGEGVGEMGEKVGTGVGWGRGVEVGVLWDVE